MATTKVPRTSTLQSSGSPITVRELLMLRGTHVLELGPNSDFTIAGDLLVRWEEISGDDFMSIDFLRQEMRLAYFGEAPDQRTRFVQQKAADAEIALALAGQVLTLVRSR